MARDDPPDVAASGDSDLPTRTSRGASGEHQIMGNYRLVEQIGVGGMGEVYRAEQTDPIKRTVAVKIVKRGMDTKTIIARFEAERQALALMDHPSIAKVFDAGSTPRGRPYFVMEHVPGSRITTYCDKQRLTTRERLELFIKLCAGVQHAHQRAIIHRDLKPSNVLVTILEGKPVPKIIDFGVAKATAQKLTEKTMYTALGELIGTPEYMSPEQAEMTGEGIDTRTDVYSLGVILYELLVGALPFDPRELRQSSFDEIRRVIREEEPARPSTRVTQVGDRLTESARSRRTDPTSLLRQLRGDLDWITMKALEKNPNRRYGSPSELAADIERHLRHLPVVARPPTTSYRVARFVRRHRVAVAAATGLVFILVAFATTTALQSRRIATERDHALQAEARATAVNDFLVHDLLRAASPEESEGQELTVTEVLQDASRRVGVSFAGQPELEVSLRITMGEVYSELGRFDDAEEHFAAAERIGQAKLGHDDIRTLQATRGRADVLAELGQDAQAEPIYRDVLARQRDTVGPRHPETLQTMNDLGWALIMLDRYDEAETLLRETLEARREIFGEDHEASISSVASYAGVLRRLGSPDAERYHRECYERSLGTFGDRHPRTLTAANNLAVFLESDRQWEEAETMYREVVRASLEVNGAGHPHTLIDQYNLAVFVARRLEKPWEAVELLWPVLDGWKAQRLQAGRIHAANYLGQLLIPLGRAPEAESVLAPALPEATQIYGEGAPMTLLVLVNLGWAYRSQGKLADAESCYRKTFEGRHESLGPDHQYTLRVKGQLGWVVAQRGRTAEGERLAREAIEHGRKVLAEGHGQLAAMLENLGRILAHTGRPTEAEQCFREALQVRQAKNHSQIRIAECQNLLGESLLRQGRLEDAEDFVADAYKVICRKRGANYTTRQSARQSVLELYERIGAPKKAKLVLAAPTLEEAARLSSRTP